jgi:hypothetical protein
MHYLQTTLMKHISNVADLLFTQDYTKAVGALIGSDISPLIKKTLTFFIRFDGRPMWTVNRELTWKYGMKNGRNHVYTGN